MKKIFFLLLTNLLLFNILFSINLLSNPSFETNSFLTVSSPFDTTINTSIWGKTNYVERVNNQSYDGNYSLFVSKPIFQLNKGFEQIVYFSKGNYSTVDLSLYAKNNYGNNGSYAMYVYFLDSNRSVLSYYYTFFVPQSNWSKFLLTNVSIHNNTSYIQVVVRAPNVYSGVYSAYFDKIELIPQ
ncbi:MAG: hypothetical protein QXF70_03755 [Candidatus Bilamarchaeaceae archaeon]